MIVFDELKYAEDILKNGYKNEKYITFDNIILVKYWKHLGLTEDEIKKKLKSTMSSFQNLFNGNILEYKVKKAINVGMKYDLLTGITVEITDKEIDKINTLDCIDVRKMMFILLLVWKFKGNPKRFKINNVDLMRLSKVSVHHNTFWKHIHEITKSKMISLTQYKGRDYYVVHFDDVGGETLFKINNFDNPIYYYLSLIEPDNYKECEECGVVIKAYNTRKYCENCAREMELEKYKKYNKKRFL